MGTLIYITDEKFIGNDKTPPPRLSIDDLNWLMSICEGDEKICIGAQRGYRNGVLINGNIDNQTIE